MKNKFLVTVGYQKFLLPTALANKLFEILASDEVQAVDDHYIDKIGSLYMTQPMNLAMALVNTPVIDDVPHDDAQQYRDALKARAAMLGKDALPFTYNDYLAAKE